MPPLLGRFLRSQQAGLVLVVLLLGTLLTVFAGSHPDRVTGEGRRGPAREQSTNTGKVSRNVGGGVFVGRNSGRQGVRCNPDDKNIRSGEIKQG